MARARQCWTLALVVVASASMTVSAGAAASDRTFADGVPVVAPWPCRLTITGELRVAAELAWEHSPTFRDQCQKLAATEAVVVVQPVASRGARRAETRIRRTADGMTVAISRMRPTGNAVELIAHELEHVLEFTEGLKFLMESSRGNSRVRLSGGAYETQRAMDAGRRVAQEVRDAIAGRQVNTRQPRAGAPIYLPHACSSSSDTDVPGPHVQCRR